MGNILSIGLTIVACIGALSSKASATQEQQLTAVGQSAIYGADVANARDKAIEDAMRKAVEQALGAVVSSETVTENFQLISDKILSKSRGYVRRYEVVEEKQDNGVYMVKIAAVVAKGNLANDLDGILQVLEAKNMPRVLLMVSEQNVGSSQTVEWWTGEGSFGIDLGAVENTLIDVWKPLGLRFVDRQALQGKLHVDNALTSASGDSDVKAFAIQTGAEIVVMGKAIATDVGTIMGTPMHSVRANISLRALNLDTGEVLGTSTQTQAVGHVDPATGGTQALKKVSTRAADDLLKKLLAQWEGQVAGPSTVSLTVKNCRKSKYARRIAEALRNQVRGVQDVRQRSFRKRVARLEVSVKGSAQQLAEELEEKNFPGFEVEVEEITTNTVTVQVISK